MYYQLWYPRLHLNPLTSFEGFSFKRVRTNAPPIPIWNHFKLPSEEGCCYTLRNVLTIVQCSSKHRIENMSSGLVKMPAIMYLNQIYLSGRLVFCSNPNIQTKTAISPWKIYYLPRIKKITTLHLKKLYVMNNKLVIVVKVIFWINTKNRTESWF